MKIKILIGSVLKPVDDIRHYHKIAKSLLNENTEIHIFGYYSDTTSDNEQIIFHSSKKFERISFSRIWRTIQFLFLGLKLRPDLIICATHELLKASTQIKILTGSKVIYDVQENYFSNIIDTTTFPFIVKYPLALIVKLNEYTNSLFVSHFLLAERCYLDELSFVNDKNSTIVENKLKNLYPKINTQYSLPNIQHFIITGTLTKLYGIYEGVTFFKNVNQIYSRSKLSITGICRTEELFHLLNYSSITLNVKKEPIPHSEIIKLLEQGGIALMPYQANKSTANKIPTKFYEYLFYKIPMIIQMNTVWEEFLKPYKAALFIDFKDFDVKDVLSKLENFDFYSGKEVGSEILWESEKEKLFNIQIIKETLN